MYPFLWMGYYLKMTSTNFQLFCLGINVLILWKHKLTVTNQIKNLHVRMSIFPLSRPFIKGTIFIARINSIPSMDHTQ